MIGQYLSRFNKWIDEAIESNELFISEDIDWFIDSPPKDEWLLLGFSLSALAKIMLERRRVICPVGLVIPLRALSRQGKVPVAVTNSLLGKVDELPTIYILKGYENNAFIREEREFLSRFVQIAPGPLLHHIEGEVFYCEQKCSTSGKPYCERFLLFLF